MKLLSWNVNGVRAILRKDFEKIIDKLKPDVVCLQETKAHPDQVDKIMHDYDHHFWNSAERKGYSGTAVFSKIQPKAVTYGIENEKHDKEGRVITVEYDKLFLVNCYTPNSGNVGRDVPGLTYREEWDKEFLKYLKKLDKDKPVLLCGDLNVANTDLDLKNHKENYNKSAGYMQEEIDGINNMWKAGFLDSWRKLNPEKEQYTWWSYRAKGARDRNIGWRIDYWVVSERFMKNVKNATILDQVKGSDHCPVELEII